MLKMNNINPDSFKKEWSNYEEKGVINKIEQYYKQEHPEELNITQGRYNRRDSIEDILGLAYTSSSMCAMLGVCNVRVENSQGQGLIAFMLTNNNILIANYQDDEENDYYYRLD